MKLSPRIRHMALSLTSVTAILGLAGGTLLSGCGSIHTYGGIEHCYDYDFADGHYPHHHHSEKAYKKYRKEQKKRYKAYKKYQKKMAKKHHRHHHHDDD